jgi:putative ABC transport system permease protein
LAIKAVWKQQAGDMPFQYEFVDEAFAARLQTQQQFSNALQIMSGLALLIAGLGLLGMVIYSLEQRSKEIGIRKISGASFWNILVLITHGHTKLIVIAFAVAAPLSYWLIQQWLQDFGNRITPSVWIFVLTGFGTLLLSFLITSYHSVKAALTNPIEVLKDE